MNTIKYITGDATSPSSDQNKIIVHICNDIGGWGKGFVLALSKKWSQPEKEYRDWFKSQDNFSLGKVQFVPVENDIWIANMIGQHKIKKAKNGNAPIRYDAVKCCLFKVSQKAKELMAEVHMPRIGCGLAGGDWREIEEIINETLISQNINVVVYDFE